MALMDRGHFVKGSYHSSFVALLYYTAVRVSEALRTRTPQITVKGDRMFYDVGKRLKHSKRTGPLPIPLDLPYVDDILDIWADTPEGLRLWTFSRKTAYNVVSRVHAYPHFFRLSRVTNLFLEGWTIPEVRSWTGITVQNLEAYVGMVDVYKMGDSLK